VSGGWSAAAISLGTLSFACIDGDLPENGSRVWGEFGNFKSFVLVGLVVTGNTFDAHNFSSAATLLLLAFDPRWSMESGTGMLEKIGKYEVIRSLGKGATAIVYSGP
jgi:hypothetical protein